MNKSALPWQVELDKWLTVGYPRILPPDDPRTKLWEAFMQRFPKDKLGELTLQTYAQGRGDRDTFCNQLEFRLRELGNVGAAPVSKWGVWWSRHEKEWRWHPFYNGYSTAEEILERIKEGLQTLVQEVEMGRFDRLDAIAREHFDLLPNPYALRCKPLYLYFPQEFLPIVSPRHLQHFLTWFGEQPASSAVDALALNRQLLLRLRSLSEFAEFDTQQMGEFLYAHLLDGPPPGELGATDDSPTPLISMPPLVSQIVRLTKQTRNIILYGPPGTGKTWTIMHLARHLGLHRDAGEAMSAGHVDFISFHQSYAYEEFVEGLKPLAGIDGEVRFAVQPGTFRRICEKAERDPNQAYLLVIDEINRANIAKVFGELISIIEDDKRIGQPNALSVTLPYSGKSFGVPGNLLIVGTMNTADRSIALLDLALRRRFAFVEVVPEPDLLQSVEGVNLAALLARLNLRITALLDRDHQLGHSYLLDAKDFDSLHFTWYHRVVPLLQEYFFNDGERLQAVIGGDFVVAMPFDKQTRIALGGIYDADLPRYQIANLTSNAFLAALRKLAGETIVVPTKSADEIAVSS